MNKVLVFLFLLFPFLASNIADAQVAKETSLMTKDLPDVPGKEGLIETVVFSQGEVVPAHRHNADVFAHVLEGRSLLN
jgi:quercetin dioxygenase-like cupin family protein